MEQVVVLSAAVVAGVLVVVLTLFTLRRWHLARVGGSFDCSVRIPRPRTGGEVGARPPPWAQGVARFGSDRVDWWKVFSLSPRPGWTWRRDDLAVLERRWPAHPEADAVLPQSVVVRCEHRGEPLDLAMSQEAYTGFASWLEAAPPGPRSQVT